MNINQLCQAIIDGDTIEIREQTPHGTAWRQVDNWFEPFKVLSNNPTKVRIAPKKAVVDMTHIEQFNIDCEFSHGPNFPDVQHPIGTLQDIIETNEGLHYVSKNGHNSIYCRPRLDTWFPWFGGKCPLPEGMLVELKYRDGSPSAVPLCSSQFSEGKWMHTRCDADIIAFKITGLEDGYCWPWEVKS